MFHQYTDDMIQVLHNNAISTSNDPNYKAVDRCLPGVSMRFDDMTLQLNAINQGIEQMHSFQAEYMDKQFDGMRSFVSSHFDSKQRQLTKAMAQFLKNGINLMGEVVVNHNQADDLSTELEGCLLDASRTLNQSDREAECSPNIANGLNQSCNQQKVSVGNSTLITDSDKDEFSKFYGVYMQAHSHGHQKSYLLKDLYSEFFGIGNFDGPPIIGGFAELELKYKNKWRQGKYSTKEISLFPASQ
ncbi:hypothetical protein ACA910_005649 [Epithemia clementina (nom. ined.)]